MDPFGLVAGEWWVGLPAAFVLGMALGLSPYGWPVIALAIGTKGATAPDDEGRTATRGLPFHRRVSPAVVGIGAAVVLVYTTLGFVTDRLDAVLRVAIGSVAGIIYASIALLSIGAGAALLARPDLVCRVRRPQRARRVDGPLGGFVVGIPIALASCPSCAAVITGVALAAGATGSTSYSVAAMAALGVGHAASLIGGSMVVLRPFEDSFRLAATVRRTGAVVLILVGGWYALQASRYGLSIAEPMA